tara:strand:+ start:665 stop:1357 length:693 start_codon:yes stop_codon:yes gene_type:complete
MKYLIIIITLLTFFSCTEGEVITINNPNLLPLADPFTDPRDGEEYGTVTIDGMRWLASNLRYTDIASNGDTLSYDKNTPSFYGKYYNTDRMLNVCPSGWHLPSDEEWTQLEEWILGRKLTPSDISPWTSEGKVRGNYANKLKHSGADWNGEGTDDHGLNIFATGVITFNTAEPITGKMTMYMTSTTSYLNNNKYYFRHFRHNEEGIIREVLPIGTEMIAIKKTSCRCIED